MKPYTFAAAGLVIGLTAGYVGATSFSTQAADTERDRAEMEQMAGMADDMQMSDSGHMHAMLEVDSSLPVPTVSLEAFPDTKDGYNLHVMVEDFAFAPERAGGAATPGEGHAHLFVNGTKVARLYGAWYHLGADALRDGENSVEVTLNANDHSEWTRDGSHIAATLTLEK